MQDIRCHITSPSILFDHMQDIRMARQVFYMVFVGRGSGVYTSWPKCQEQVIGFKGNVYKSYNLIEEARRA